MTSAAETDICALLDQHDIDVVRHCLNAATNGPFFPDWEFQTLLGVDRATVRKVLLDWPAQTVPHVDFVCAVAGSVNNLTGYPHDREDVWDDYIPASRAQVSALLDTLIAKGLKARLDSE
jgi:hypothetical protein